MGTRVELGLLARALGVPQRDLEARASALRSSMRYAEAHVAKALLDQLAREAERASAAQARRSRESGIRMLERALREAEWERFGRSWIPGSGVELGSLGLGDRMIWIVDDLQARAFAFALQVARSSSSLFIGGETGTGKESLARAYHLGSGRHGPFVAINCSAIPRDLAEAELFGVVDRAATQTNPRLGAFRAAHGGTIFLDEFAALPLDIQPKLLRAVQELRIKPVGADREVAVDTRIVTASNKDIEAEVRRGRIMEDLWFRVSQPSVALPALRGRHDAILVLAIRFLEREGKRVNRPLRFAADAVRVLLDYAWPGNIRQLERAVYVAAVQLHDERIVYARHLSVGPTRAATKPRPSLSESEQELYNEAKRLQNKLSLAQIAKRLGSSKRHIDRLLNNR